MGNCQKFSNCTNNDSSKPQKSLILFIIGILIISAGIIILMVAVVFYGESSANIGAIIFIGPIPIVVGAGPEATWMVLFGIILAVLSAILFLLLRRKAVKANT
jgi:uncharacterized membrane protein